MQTQRNHPAGSAGARPAGFPAAPVAIGARLPSGCPRGASCAGARPSGCASCPRGCASCPRGALGGALCSCSWRVRPALGARLESFASFRDPGSFFPGVQTSVVNYRTVSPEGEGGAIVEKVGDSFLLCGYTAGIDPR